MDQQDLKNSLKGERNGVRKNQRDSKNAGKTSKKQRLKELYVRRGRRLEK